jgi:hypothetical protein
VIDVEASIESYDLGFDSGGFRSDLGTPVTEVKETSFSPLLLELHVHRAGEGLRPFALFGIGVTDISRPAISYTDQNSQLQTVEGVEVFSLDPCFALGGGIDYQRDESRLGGSIKARYIAVPGHTEPAQGAFTVTTSLSFALWSN